ncbi:MAG TPA: copper homeostasis protein CutC, partial [Xanthomonadaceae bacterium]|nr:copper homeostasis protein CutC [Xanthomonadaceae bacterium]
FRSAAIADVVAQAHGRVQVTAGAGITPDNIAAIARRTGADALHASAKALRHSAMRHDNRALVGLDADWQATDVRIVAALRRALDAAQVP